MVKRDLLNKLEGEPRGQDVLRALPEVGPPILPLVPETIDDEFVGHRNFARTRRVVNGMVSDSTLR